MSFTFLIFTPPTPTLPPPTANMSLLWMFIVDKVDDTGSGEYLRDEQDPFAQELSKIIFQTISRNDEASIKIKQELDELPAPQSREGSQMPASQVPTSQEVDRDFVVDLVATDGERTYNAVIKSKFLSFYLTADKGTESSAKKEEEWRKVVMSILFGTPLVASRPVVATYNKSSDNKTLTLNIRQGHAPRPGAEASIPILGSLNLVHKPARNKSSVSSVFEMLVLSASKLGPSLAEARMVRTQFAAVQGQISNFLQDKVVAENELYEKFAMLLNKKKAKLRALKAGLDVSDSEDEESFMTAVTPPSVGATTPVINQNEPNPLKRGFLEESESYLKDNNPDESDEPDTPDRSEDEKIKIEMDTPSRKPLSVSKSSTNTKSLDYDYDRASSVDSQETE